jgi:hypothetical protein
MIIKHPTDAIDHFRQAFSAVRGSPRIAQPGFQSRRVLERNVDQRSPSPCPEVAFAQLPKLFGLSTKTRCRDLASPLGSTEPGSHPPIQPPNFLDVRLAGSAEDQCRRWRRWGVGNHE